MAGVAAETAERVREVARQMGYEPNAAARLLVERRFRARAELSRPAVALVRFGPSFHPALQAEDAVLAACAQREGFALQSVRVDAFDSPAAMSRILWSRGVQGLLLHTRGAPPDSRLEDLAGFAWERFALVKISRGFDALRCHTVRVSVFLQMRYTLERVARAGYRRIALLLLSRTASNDDDWSRLGAIEAFRRLRADAFERFEVFPTPLFDRQTLTPLRAELKRMRADILIGFPFAWRYLLEEAGYNFPRDLAYVGVPVIPNSAADGGRPTTGPLDDFVGMEFPAALRLLGQEIAVGHHGFPDYPYEHVLPVVWQAGTTMPDPAPSRAGRRRRLARPVP